MAWVGWQGDWTPGRGMRVDVPKLEGVTGPSREEFVFDNRTRRSMGNIRCAPALPHTIPNANAQAEQNRAAWLPPACHLEHAEPWHNSWPEAEWLRVLKASRPYTGCSSEQN
jgi:hypothetical protein